MAVTRKPVARPHDTAEHTKPDEATIRAIIERGGSVAGENNATEVERRLLQLRLPVALISRIDGALRSRAVPPSRHHWILEAIHEKLAREEGDEAREKPAP
jgi:hypothetical protein